MSQINKDRQLKLPKNSGLMFYQSMIPVFSLIAKKLNIQLEVDGLDIMELQNGFAINAPVSIFSPSSNPFTCEIESDSVLVSPRSYLFNSLNPSSVVSIAGLDTPIAIEDGDDVYLEITFDTWPTIDSAEIKAGTMGNALVFVGGTQTVARKLIGRATTLDSDLIINHFTTTNLIMRQFTDAGQVVSYPMPS